MSAWLTIQLSRTAAPAVALALAATITGCGHAPQAGNHAGNGRGNRGVAAARPESPAAFLASYVRSNGRVARPDQESDTVSEGQAYGLLLAETAGDHAAFGRIWDWTRAHLQRRDGLFAYHADAAGHVLSWQSASDADLLIAWALLRYTGPDAAARHAAGRRVADAVLAHEMTTGPGGAPVLTAGPWATGRPASLNPSYWSLTAFDGLASLTGDVRWRELAAAAVSLTQRLTNAGRMLPPDWAALSADGQLRPEPAPDGTQPQPQYGLDAQRTVVWFATSCDARARALAARWWPKLAGSSQSRALALRPDGAVLNAEGAPLPFVAAAAAAHAANDKAAAALLLRRAGQQQRKYPTYYGGAWAALGPALLHGSLARC